MLTLNQDLSPVGDAYKKKGLAPAKDRIKMCELATNTPDQKTKFIMVDTWEGLQSKYQPTAQVLDHFNYELNTKMGGVDDGTGKKVPVKICLLGGADLVETFSQPGVWSPVDLNHILGNCESISSTIVWLSCVLLINILDGVVTIERAGTDLDDAISKLEPSKN